MKTTSCLPSKSARIRALCQVLLAAMSVLLFHAIAVYAQDPGSAPIHVPVTMFQKSANGIKKPRISVGIGNMGSFPVDLDTGSSGLRVFADANLINDRTPTNSGVKCSDIGTSVTYGNPALITYSGVICYATLTFGTYVSPQPVPFAYLFSASCGEANQGCTPPDLTSVQDMGGFGILGLGLTGPQSGTNIIPNPVLTLPAPYSCKYSVRLTNEDQGGELVLGDNEPPNAVSFKLPPSTDGGAKWANAKASLFVNASPIDTSFQISFDTGNPVPWIHNPGPNTIPQCPTGVVENLTTIGWAPPGQATQTFSVVAGTTEFVDLIRVLEIMNSPSLTNTSIQVFYGQIVTYDNFAGTISFAPMTPTGP
jgi:hypothetical protein